ncbi:MAG: glycosyltransferase family 4 protein [Candidatus Sumerlaeia bacterium]|nr:glycosyltransferase family 4 protein [Candidatus Sumerlaeia bacterium]
MAREKLHVLEVCRSFPYHQPGGLEWHALDVVEGLMDAGAKVSVLTTSLPGARAGLAPLRVNGAVHALGRKQGHYSIEFFRRLAGTVAWISRRERVDIVHAQGFAGVPLGLASGLPPVVTTIHGTLWSETPLRPSLAASLPPAERLRLYWRYKHRLAFQPLWRRFLAAEPNIVTDSRFTVRELQRETGMAVAADVVPLGVDLRRYPQMTKAEARRELAFSQSETILLLAGRMVPLKGHGFALRALSYVSNNPDFAKLEPWRVVVAGDGPERAGLEEACRQYGFGSRVRFLDRVSSDGLARLFSAADVFLNPDAGSPAFGLVTAEALICGAPVIAADSGATGELVNDPRDGVLVPTGGEGIVFERWCDAMRELHRTHPEPEQARLERQERNRARFHRRVMAYGLLEVFERAMRSDGMVPYWMQEEDRMPIPGVRVPRKGKKKEEELP